MSDPRTLALDALTRLLSRASRAALEPNECLQLAEQVRLVPGFARRVAHALSAQRSAAAVDALMTMSPQIPGVVEGIHAALAHGVTRVRLDGSDCEPMLALEFGRSRARVLDEAIGRAQALFGDTFECMEVDGAPCYRFIVQAGRGTLAGRAAAVSHDVQWLHARLSKLRGTRLWLNGWSFAHDGPFSGDVQVHFVRAWLGWAATQTETHA